jgi:hypothetical protein
MSNFKLKQIQASKEALNKALGMNLGPKQAEEARKAISDMGTK